MSSRCQDDLLSKAALLRQLPAQAGMPRGLFWARLASPAP